MGLILYGRDSSYNVQKVLWLLAELELEVGHEQCGGKYGGTDTAEFGALNPMRKVPVLFHDGHAIWESNTILRYLVASVERSQWYPPNAWQRSEYERWMDWSQTQFEPAFIGVFWGYYRTPESQRKTAAIEQSLLACQACLSSLQLQLGGQQYLVGDQPTLADICCGVFLYRLMEIDLGVELPSRVAAWYQRLQDRAAYRQWVMRDFSELSGRLAY